MSSTPSPASINVVDFSRALWLRPKGSLGNYIVLERMPTIEWLKLNAGNVDDNVSAATTTESNYFFIYLDILEYEFV